MARIRSADPNRDHGAAPANQDSDFEEELSRATERLALILEADRLAPFATWDWDLVRDVARWSDEMYVIFGRDPSVVPTYKMSLEFMHPEDRPMVDAAVQKAIAHGTLYDLKYRVVRPDGTERWIHGVGQAYYDAAGAPLFMAGACVDITEHHE